jgi:hypothetical protein
MPRGSKSKYTNRQKRQAEHIEKGYEKRGTSKKEAERRAWATVNKTSGGGEKGGSGSRSRKGGSSSSRRPASARRASARKAARTRARSSR